MIDKQAMLYVCNVLHLEANVSYRNRTSYIIRRSSNIGENKYNRDAKMRPDLYRCFVPFFRAEIKKLLWTHHRTFPTFFSFSNILLKKTMWDNEIHIITY